MSGEESSSDAVPPAGGVSEGASRAVIVRRLFEEHNRKLIRFLVARLQNEQDAVEIAQEAYVQLLQLEKPSNASLLQAYLFRIARNLAVDRMRFRRVRSEHSQTAHLNEMFSIDLEREYLAGEELQLFKQAVSELPDKCRAAFILNKFDELGPEEIARRLGIGARMVRKHLVHAIVYCDLRLRGSTPDEARRQTWR